MDDVLDSVKSALGRRYAVEDEIGSGGMATVYLAEDQRHRRKVAVKVLRPELAAALGAERFLREIEIAAGLQHPHILPLYDSGEAGGLLYYVMPYVEGDSLRDRLDQRGEQPIPATIRLLRDVVDALAHAHERGVIHRDIKPENVMLSGRHALVTDFGVAKAVSEATGRHELTTAGVALGTPVYMAPEQAVADPHIDHRADLYAVGVLAYELLSGRPPFTGSTPQMILAAHVTEAPLPVSKHRAAVSPALEQMVMRCLEKTPADRYQSADSLLEELEAMATPSGGVRATAARAEPVDRGVEAAAPEGEKTIAVLPFTNMSADPENEYFSDGMTEEIISALAQVSSLHVAARTSSFAFKGKSLNVREVGRELKVGSVLEGSVRKAGNRIRITAQLVDVANGYQLWSETYNRELEDVFAVQDDISRAIVEALKVKLVGDAEAPLVVPTTTNIDAYTLYLKGRFFFHTLGGGEQFTETDIRRSLDLYEEALANDPGFARAHAGIANSWSFLADDWVPPSEAYPRAKAAAVRALELDPGLPEAHTALGRILGWFDWDFLAGQQELERVVQTHPSDADARFGLATLLPTTGQYEEAVEEMRAALELDPLSASLSRWLARLLLYAGKYDESIEQSRKTLETDPKFSRAYLDMGNAYLVQGRQEEALEMYRQGQALEGSVVSYNAYDARALAALGQEEEARAVLSDMEARAQRRYIRGEVLAGGYAALGDLDRAFTWLEKAYEGRSAGLIYLHVDPSYDPMREDPRFKQYLQRLSLPSR